MQCDCRVFLANQQHALELEAENIRRWKRNVGSDTEDEWDSNTFRAEFTSNAVMHSSAMARALSRLSSMLRKKEE
jgi:hypothetical protein